MVIMLRLYCLIIGLVVPTFGVAQTIRVNDSRGRSIQKSAELTSVLERVIRGELQSLMTTSKLDQQRDQNWHNDLLTWLLLQERTNAFDNTINQTMMAGIKLLKFETYRTGSVGFKLQELYSCHHCLIYGVVECIGSLLQ